MTIEPYELALTQAIRSLDQQNGVRESYQQRAGTIITAATVATGFLAPIAWPHHKGGADTVAVWTAIAAFIVVILAVLFVLQSRTKWQFSIDPRLLIETYIESGKPLGPRDIVRDIALHFGNAYEDNEKKLKSLYLGLTAAGLFLIVEMVAWVAALAL